MKELYLNPQPYAFGGVNVDPSKTPFSVVGIPLEGTTSFRGGTRFAPQYIRVMSQSLEMFSLRSGVDMEKVMFHDLGDVNIYGEDLEGILNNLEKASEELYEEGRVLVFLGGEHTLSIATVSAFLRSYSSRTPCVLVFDAHADLREQYLGSRFSHACVMSRILEFLSRDAVMIVGLRAVSGEEWRRVKKENLNVITSLKLRKMGLRTAVARVSDWLSTCGKLYISLDMDVFDPSYAPGVTTPEPEGLSPYDVFEILYNTVDRRLAGFDVTEVAPPYDHGMVTAALAAKVVIEVASYYIKARLSAGEGK